MLGRSVGLVASRARPFLASLRSVRCCTHQSSTSRYIRWGSAAAEHSGAAARAARAESPTAESDGDIVGVRLMSGSVGEPDCPRGASEGGQIQIVTGFNNSLELWW